MKNTYYIKETTSTNVLLWELAKEKELPEGFIVYTDMQSAGRGQAGNFWESESKKNLLFSVLLKPSHINIAEHFLLSQQVSIAIKDILDKYTDDIKIKWPNDIYWKDRKLVGILIENSLQLKQIRETVIGIGININQMEFNFAPNAVSLKEITGKHWGRKKIMKDIRDRILEIYKDCDKNCIRELYWNGLYLKDGFHLYEDSNETFEACINDIQPDGRLDLQLRNGEIRGFYFREIKFI